MRGNSNPPLRTALQQSRKEAKKGKRLLFCFLHFAPHDEELKHFTLLPFLCAPTGYGVLRVLAVKIERWCHRHEANTAADLPPSAQVQAVPSIGSPMPSATLPYNHSDVRELIALALREDLRDGGDITCRSLVPQRARLDGIVRAKAAGVLCGLPLFQLVFDALAEDMPGCEVIVTHHVSDGTVVRPGDEVLRCSGNAVTMLIGERTALNLCQRLSGTATMARRYVEAIAGTKAHVFDTRKTTPGMRLLEKNAVISGGARNHRIGLYDQVLIKDNHIALMPPGPLGSGPAEAVRRTRENIGDDILIEVEIERLDDLEPVIIAGADIVLLDNMAPELMREAVQRRDRLLANRSGSRRVALEASGGITLATIRAVAETGVERISIGALTHSVHALDLSMRTALVIDE